MVETAFLVEPHRKSVKLVRYRSIMVLIGVGPFLLFIGKTVGTAQELSTGTIGLSDRVSMERSDLGRVNDPAAATQNGQATASPGQWLIDDVARERAEFDLRQVRPRPLSATKPSRAANVEVGVGLPSSDNTLAGADKRRSVTVEDGGLGAPAFQRAPKRSDSAPPRPDTSRGLADSPTKCIEVPVGRAPEGEHWYYRLDRETHRKCWYVRAFKEDRAEPSVVESDRGLSEPTSPDPLDSIWAWWYWR
jgi:hypothetical protein